MDLTTIQYCIIGYLANGFGLWCVARSLVGGSAMGVSSLLKTILLWPLLMFGAFIETIITSW